VTVTFATGRLASVVLADSDKGKGSPIGFFVILILCIAVYFLYRSLAKHIRRVPASFDPPTPPSASPHVPGDRPVAEGPGQTEDRPQSP
jgi:hypothetical protein